MLAAINTLFPHDEISNVCTVPASIERQVAILFQKNYSFLHRSSLSRGFPSVLLYEASLLGSKQSFQNLPLQGPDGANLIYPGFFDAVCYLFVLNIFLGTEHLQ